MIRIRDLALPPADHPDAALKNAAARKLGINPADLLTVTVRRRSIDARHKPDVRFIFTLDCAVRGDEKALLRRLHDPGITLAEERSYAPEPLAAPVSFRPVIVGFGPAGMFCALTLAKCGVRPIVLERGGDVDTRSEKVLSFFAGGAFDPECNVQFGEGGAGTFSDGKLNTGVNDPRIAWILSQFVSFGAPEQITYDARPHVGTDVLKTVVRNLREELVRLGGEVRFGTRLDALETENGAVTAALTSAGERIACSALVLAVGHSARDTVKMLFSRGVAMEPKPFSMGVRIEHRQSAVDEAQYGARHEDAHLPAAEYRLNVRLPDGNSAYTFCMCPGGSVIAAASEEGGVCTNGMSLSARDGENANSALLVTLTPEDFPDRSPLGGMRWQRELEMRAFAAGGKNYRAPAQTVGDFLGTPAAPSVTPTYRPGVTWCDLHTVLPPKITQTLERALPELGKKLRAFSDGGAVLTAPETRSSSPVRILRDESLQSSVRGLYPCGEGAGYAGGIVSAALDGIRTAEAILDTLRYLQADGNVL